MTIAAVTLVCVGVTYSVLLLTFNGWYRNLRFIKMTSPRINYLVLAGALSLYGFSLLCGVEFVQPSSNQLNQRVFYWLFTIGFTLMYGSMLVKGWRVYRLFRYQKQTRKELLRDGNLVVGLLTLLVIDVAFMLGWQLSDPVTCTDGWPAHCVSAHMRAWLLSLSLYKQAGLVICCYVGWSIRHLTLPCLDDGRSLLLCSGVTLLCCGFVFNLLYLYPMDTEVVTSLVSILSWLLTTFTLTVNFMPKVYIIYKSGGRDPFVLSASKCIQQSPSSDITQEIIRIVSENHSLKQLLEQKEHLIGQLKRLIPSASADRAGVVSSQSASNNGTPTKPTNQPPAIARLLASCCSADVTDGNGHPAGERFELSEERTCHTHLRSQSNELVISNCTAMDASIHSTIAATAPSVPSGEMHVSMLASDPWPLTADPDLAGQGNMQLICSIANSYNLPDDSDTLSYISSCLNRQTHSYSGSTSVLDWQRPANRLRGGHCSSGGRGLAPSMSASYTESTGENRPAVRKHRRSASLGGSNRTRSKRPHKSSRPHHS